METKDLNYAAYLLAKGQQLENCQTDNDGRCWFIFIDTDELKDLNKEYYTNTGLVSPQSFINAQKSLKNLIRNYKPLF